MIGSQFINKHRQKIEDVNKPVKRKPRDGLLIPENAAPDFKVWLVSVIADNKLLKAMPNHDDRDKTKPDLVAKYKNYLIQWMASEQQHENQVLLFNLVWAADIQDWDWMLELADYAVVSEQDLSAIGFTRNAVTFAADAVFQVADTAQKSNSEPLPVFTEIFERVDAGTWSINESFSAYIYRLMGILLMESEPEKALVYLETATKLKHDIGVKTRIDSLTKKLAKGK